MFSSAYSNYMKFLAALSVPASLRRKTSDIGIYPRRRQDSKGHKEMQYLLPVFYSIVFGAKNSETCFSSERLTSFRVTLSIQKVALPLKFTLASALVVCGLK